MTADPSQAADRRHYHRRAANIEYVQRQLWSVFAGDFGLETIAERLTGRHHAWRTELNDLVNVAAPMNCIGRIRVHLVAGRNLIVASIEAKIGSSLPPEGHVNIPRNLRRMPNCRAQLVVEFYNARRLWGLKQLRHRWCLYPELVHLNAFQARLVSQSPGVVDVDGDYFPIHDLSAICDDEPLHVLLFRQANRKVYAATSPHRVLTNSA
jgi:hypothetical protein